MLWIIFLPASHPTITSVWVQPKPIKPLIWLVLHYDCLYETGIKEIKTLTCQKNNKDKPFSVGTIVASSLLKDATTNLENVKQNYFLIFELYT